MVDIICGDLHVPYHDEKAVNVVLKLARKLKPDNIVLNGDVLDANSLSHFTKDPVEPEAFKSELDDACDIVSDFQRRSNVIWIEGNHESRLGKYVNSNASELYGLLSMEALINERLDNPIEYVYTMPTESFLEWRPDLLIGHFRIARKYCCYTAKALVERFQISVIQGHTHRLGQYGIRTYKENLYGYEGGCLCNLDPTYTLHPNWEQGVLVFEDHDDGWTVEVVHINDGVAFYRGSVYRG